MAVALFVIISSASLVILAVMLVSLGRHARRLADALVEFQREVEPVLEEIRKGSEEAEDRLEKMRARREAAGAGSPG